MLSTTWAETMRAESTRLAPEGESGGGIPISWERGRPRPPRSKLRTRASGLPWGINQNRYRPALTLRVRPRFGSPAARPMRRPTLPVTIQPCSLSLCIPSSYAPASWPRPSWPASSPSPRSCSLPGFPPAIGPLTATRSLSPIRSASAPMGRPSPCLTGSRLNLALAGFPRSLWLVRSCSGGGWELTRIGR